MTRRDPPIRYPFAALIRLRIEQPGWSAARLARQAGVGTGTVRRVLAGQDVMLSSALKIAEALRLPAGRLGKAADLNRPAPPATAPEPPDPADAEHAAEHQLRCWECASCDKPGALVCNDPEGICHPGDCEPEADR